MHRTPLVSPRVFIVALFCCVLPLRLSATTPHAVDDVIATNEDTPITYNVLTNDYDVDGDTVKFVAVTQQPAHGAAISQGSGSVMYVPAPNFNGVDTFEYWVNDGTISHRDGATVIVYVLAANDAPTAVEDRVATNEETPMEIAVLANDSDTDGDALQVSAVTDPTTGTVQINITGTVTYTPPLNFLGNVTFTYTATDGHGGTATATVYVTVSDVSDAPVAQNDTYTATEDTALTVSATTGVLANDTDVDGNPLSAAKVTDPAHGTLTLNADGSFTYTPSANYSGTDSFTYRASDGVLASNTATATITVPDVNDAPTVSQPVPDVFVEEDTQFVWIDLSAVFDDKEDGGDALSLDVMSVSNWNLVLGYVVGDPHQMLQLYIAPDASGTATITVRATDAGDLHVDDTFQVTVSPVNDLPVAAADAYTWIEDGGVLTVVAPGVLGNDTDADGDVLDAHLVQDVSHGVLALNGDGSFTYTPAVDFGGTDGFTYYAAEVRRAQSDPVAVVITVVPVNDAPTVSAALPDQTVNEDAAAVTLDLFPAFTDKEDSDDALTFSVVGNTNPSLVTTSITGDPNQLLRLSFAANASGTANITVRAADSGGARVNDTFTVDVTAVNDAPVASDDAAQTTAETAVVIDVLANDTHVDNGQSLTVTPSALPLHGHVSSNGTYITYRPSPFFTGEDSFSYEVEDDGNPALSDTATVIVTVTAPANTAPVALSDSYTLVGAVLDVAFSSPLASVLWNDYDADGDGLMAILGTEPTHGTVQFYTNGTFVYTLTDAFGGTDSFTYTATDGQETSEAAIVYINIKTENAEPVAQDDKFTAYKNETLRVSPPGVLDNDIDFDGDTLTVVALGTAPSHGTVTLYPDGSFVYVPTLNYADPDTPDTFTYTVTDGNDTGTATVSITVEAARSPRMQFDLTLTEGWNLVSVPIDPVDGGVAVLFGENAGVVWQWNGTAFERAETIVAKQAYWLYAPTGPVTIPIVGTAVADSVRAVPAGWSLVGPVTAEPFSPVALPRARGARGDETVLPAWRYQTSSRAYLAAGDATQLLPGLGYWVRTSAPADLELGE
ncbi:MAG: hypothetical protein A3K19_08495 [Lentisphaerae bacterium RIFOXYB12_FULL_65_16]|nr:MAG: hypothetical protein A3K18_15615 [Lentisphaerae bacterium RIFOXYA12_64_32]OGV93444.1 MAG: hypothetical protein A3K19_08495 [Lentisphaerae bacterium RIFOXYB12_FULL_65_16]